MYAVNGLGDRLSAPQRRLVHSLRCVQRKCQACGEGERGLQSNGSRVNLHIFKALRCERYFVFRAKFSAYAVRDAFSEIDFSIIKFNNRDQDVYVNKWFVFAQYLMWSTSIICTCSHKHPHAHIHTTYAERARSCDKLPKTLTHIHTETPHATHEHVTLVNSKANSFSSFFGTKCASVCPPLAVHPYIRKLKIFSNGISLMVDWLRYFLAARTQFSSFSTRLEVMYENSMLTVVSRSREAILFIGFLLFLLAFRSRDLLLIQIFFSVTNKYKSDNDCLR